jgi:PAS domain S-box-containing protein
MMGLFKSLCASEVRSARRTCGLAATFVFLQIVIAGFAHALALPATESLLSTVVGLLILCGIARSGARAEARAEESEARIRDFAEVAADWFCELDRDLRIAYVSDRLFGASPSSVEALKGVRWLEAGERFGFASLLDGHRKRLLAHEPFHDHRFRLHAQTGRTSFWSISGKPLFDRGGAFAGYRIAASDITSIIRTQEELAGARDEAQRANRAKSSFLANMSHELRTPLNAVLGFSEIIGREIMGPLGNPKYGEYARDIHDSADHLLATINDILELSRIEAGQIELREQEFALSDVIDGVLRLCRGRAGRSGIALTADVPDTRLCVTGDSLRIKQVVINLVSNAVKFTPKGGHVSIGCRREKDGAVSLAVRDNGIGMTAEGLRKAMRPFEQADNGLNRKFEGTGLGLPLARMLVEHHGGTLRVASAPGRGTVVAFTLPAWRVTKRESTELTMAR